MGEGLATHPHRLKLPERGEGYTSVRGKEEEDTSWGDLPEKKRKSHHLSCWDAVLEEEKKTRRAPGWIVPSKGGRSGDEKNRAFQCATGDDARFLHRRKRRGQERTCWGPLSEQAEAETSLPYPEGKVSPWAKRNVLVPKKEGKEE